MVCSQRYGIHQRTDCPEFGSNGCSFGNIGNFALDDLQWCMPAKHR